ncbi:FecR family protein [Brucellaceae bacterium D45D]
MSEAERRFLKSQETGIKDPWFDDGPERRAEFQQLERLWSDLDKLPDLAVLPQHRRPTRRALLTWGAGAAIAAGTAGVVLMPRADLSTPTGGRLVTALPDGSRLDMDAHSRIDLDFSDSHRGVRMLEGRARFEAVNAGRLFHIATIAGDVRLADGVVTVHLWDGEMTVTNHAGQCSVVAGSTEIRLAASEEITVGASGIGKPEQVSIGNDDWLSGRLVFENRPLRQVVSDLDRYRSGTIIMRGSSLRNLRVTGTFNASSPDVALNAITASLPVIRRDFGPLTLLTPA